MLRSDLELCARALILAVLLFGLTPVQAATNYQIDSDASSILIYTEKSGALKFFAHKHLIAINKLEGSITLSDAGGSASLIMRPVDFVVDDPELRGREQESAYRKPFKESAISGTRENMLGEGLLNATLFPEITVSIDYLRQTTSPAQFDVTVTLLGQQRTFRLPAQLEVATDVLRASADFVLTHEQLGLKPFSLLGVANVGQELRFKVMLVAQAEQSDPLRPPLQ